MGTWKKEEPIQGRQRGCAFNPVYNIAPMGMLIAVGFGDARVLKDGKTVYKEPLDFEKESDFWTTQDAENAALNDPDHDWRIVLYAPLYGRTFQRHEEGKWVLIDENRGFA